MIRSRPARLLAGLAVVLVVGGAGGYVLAQNTAVGHQMMHRMHMHGMMHGEGDMGAGMPGLQGRDATPRESEELAIMFANFETMTRTVEILPNGIRTVTGSSDPEVMAVLASHVTGMIQRVEEGRDPGIFIQSPTLDIFFERGSTITTQIEMVDGGIAVTQTSDDPELVTALQVHAGEVSAMAERGMAAVHEMMMKR